MTIINLYDCSGKSTTPKSKTSREESHAQTVSSNQQTENCSDSSGAKGKAKSNTASSKKKPRNSTKSSGSERESQASEAHKAEKAKIIRMKSKGNTDQRTNVINLYLHNTDPDSSTGKFLSGLLQALNS